MIEINLLPPQYKDVQRTPPAVFLTLIGGLVLVGLSLGGYVYAAQTFREQEDRRGAIKFDLDRARVEADKVRATERRILESQGRLETLLAISRSKVYWAQKLEQLLLLMPDWVWIDGLYVGEPREKKGQPNQPIRLELQCRARGKPGAVADFKEILRSNTNFFYHFEDSDAQNVYEETVAGEPVQIFTLILPLKKEFYAADVPQPARRR